MYNEFIDIHVNILILFLIEAKNDKIQNFYN